jgi:hypothetical protein
MTGMRLTPGAYAMPAARPTVIRDARRRTTGSRTTVQASARDVPHGSNVVFARVDDPVRKVHHRVSAAFTVML